MHLYASKKQRKRESGGATPRGGGAERQIVRDGNERERLKESGRQQPRWLLYHYARHCCNATKPHSEIRSSSPSPGDDHHRPTSRVARSVARDKTLRQPVTAKRRRDLARRGRGRKEERGGEGEGEKEGERER
eukprot:GHVU01226125.1.p1 GENE.GHVU01226125.1~~GHVU01226125.1.p1  ORF type:complete len:133 (-),score=15.66 GHVU01226125.1:217-615(-)